MNNMEDTSPVDNFVTVVSVGNKTEEETANTKEKEFVTVLRIGEDDQENDAITEEVLVYRLPGERLGFGLKFEGGTKATEYVKKLFIQSCAPDSPASKVVGSWGHLTEGDEVLVIDSHPVTSMTRMDCVKCLKDSSVVIKLLVRHQKQDSKKTEEGLPLVISAEKKKPLLLPPTPPPVPPRKIPKKHLRTKNVETKNTENNVATNKHNSPEIRFNRKLAEGCLAPPDAEFYVDLFSQDSIHSLSESDDTASTISTVVDRNGNSLPSTPKSIQKHLDLSNFPDDENMFNLQSDTLSNEDYIKDGIDLVDAANDSTYAEDITKETDSFISIQRDLMFETHDENMNIFNLPRLVDFVPKNFSHMDHKKIMNLFLYCERGEHLDFKIKVPQDPQKGGCYEEDIDMYPKWSIAPQLATIGEDEEDCMSNENISDRFLNTPPTLVVDCEEEKQQQNELETESQTMEPPPSDRRQPPDGHEFPDFEESFLNRTNERFNTRNTQEQEINTKKLQRNSFSADAADTSNLNKMTSLSNIDLSTKGMDKNKNIGIDHETKPNDSNVFSHYSRSQSLCDISSRRITSDDPLRQLVEQRRKNLSKLKGLVIPDSISECEASTTINLPEIKSNTPSLIEQFKPIASPEVLNKISDVSNTNNTVLPPITPPWAATVNFPKYSPAFKRKDLKIHSSGSRQSSELSDFKICSPIDIKKDFNDDYFKIRQKSYDSSTSRSENSSDGMTRDKPRRNFRSLSTDNSILYRKTPNTDEESDNDSAVSSSQSSFASRPTVSSVTSMEKYVKTAPSEYNPQDYQSTKVSSVEALNRKNILASAKCRSGKDFKIGSPVVNRKLEIEDDKTENAQKIDDVEQEETISVIEEKDVVTPTASSPKLAAVDLASEKVPSLVSKKITESPLVNMRNLEFKSVSRTSLPNVSTREKQAMFLNILKPVPPMVRKEEKISKFSSRKSLSVTDLRKNFEEIAKNVAATPTFTNKKVEVFPKTSRSSLSSAEESSRALRKPSVGCELPSKAKEMNKKSRKVTLKPNAPGENIGITISGGSEENKDIIVHRIRYGSVAYQDGTLIKGDRILSINGVLIESLNYTEAVQLLKAPSESYVIEVALKDEEPKELKALKRRSISLDSSLDSEKTIVNKIVATQTPSHEITLLKDQNGLGFSVEGGKDSPQGDVAITVKKIFQGGVADKDGRLKVGDQILSINDIDFTNLSRIQAWTIMKKVDLGKTKIMIYRS